VSLVKKDVVLEVTLKGKDVVIRDRAGANDSHRSVTKANRLKRERAPSVGALLNRFEVSRS
jgi:hypothetical protein